MKSNQAVLDEVHKFNNALRSNYRAQLPFGDYGIEALASLLCASDQCSVGIRSCYSPSVVDSYYLRGRMRGAIYSFINEAKACRCSWTPSLLNAAQRVCQHMKVYMWILDEEDKAHNLFSSVRCSSINVYYMTIVKRLAGYMGIHDAVFDSSAFSAVPD